MLVRNAQFARGVAVHDVRGPHGVQFFRHAFAAHVATSGLELKCVAGHARIGAAHHNVDGAQLQLHARVRTEVFARAAHGAQPAGFTAGHGNLKNRAARRIKIVQFFFRFSEKGRPEKFNSLANVVGSQFGRGKGHKWLPQELLYPSYSRYCTRRMRPSTLEFGGRCRSDKGREPPDLYKNNGWKRIESYYNSGFT